jgi:predicted RNase H-like HicB family nuclease
MIIYLRDRRRSYSIRVTNEPEGGFSGQCLDDGLSAAISQGETLDELRQNMKDAIQLVLESQQKEQQQQQRDTS